MTESMPFSMKLEAGFYGGVAGLGVVFAGMWTFLINPVFLPIGLVMFAVGVAGGILRRPGGALRKNF